MRDSKLLTYVTLSCGHTRVVDTETSRSKRMYCDHPNCKQVRNITKERALAVKR